jgi:hypothetical protein
MGSLAATRALCLMSTLSISCTKMFHKKVNIASFKEFSDAEARCELHLKRI